MKQQIKSTYRLQFNSAFSFDTARKITPYLSELGASCIYASPVFSCRKGSPHGYDVINPCAISAQAGGRGELEKLIKDAADKGLAWLQDIVPNHMSFSCENEWLMDVLENGEESEFRDFFDILWDHHDPAMRKKVLAPFLGGFFGETLEKGELKINYGETGFFISYYDNKFPLKPESVSEIMEEGLEGLLEKIGRESEEAVQVAGAVNAFKSASVLGGSRRREQLKFAKSAIWKEYGLRPEVREFIGRKLDALNSPGDGPVPYLRLEKLLTEQHYRLCYWKVGAEQINYRRFFNISELMSVKVENQEVFERTHQLIREMCASGLWSGVRVDHIDGLYDPEQYLKRLKAACPDAVIYVEKILGAGERLPATWPVEGATGYKFMNKANGLFVRRKNAKSMEAVYRHFTGMRQEFTEMVISKKRMIIGRRMAGEVENLARLMKTISDNDRHGYDITDYSLKRALVEVLAFFPVYRSYITENSYTPKDTAYVNEAVEKALSHNPSLKYEIEYIRKFLTLDLSGVYSAGQRSMAIDMIKRFQQLTGPLMAKGFEDTLLYVYNRLISLNEVGGDPDRFGIDRADFNRFCRERAKKWPRALNGGTTHDTKRGEDARARINVLSEIPDEWALKLKEWSALSYKRRNPVIDRNDEYFIYQSMLGSVPIEGLTGEFRERLKAYVIKAVREAKVHTAWIKPDEKYESAVLSFIDGLSGNQGFVKSFLDFSAKTSWYGMLNSLSQVTLRFACPGVPDIYQGAELWDFSFVDPDNRRPVDYDARKKILEKIKKETNPAGLYVSYADGAVKMFAVNRLLRMRAENHALFTEGEYAGLKASGVYGKNITAFARKIKGGCAIAVVPRFFTDLCGLNEPPTGAKWKDTVIETEKRFYGTYRDVFTGSEIEIKGRTDAAAILGQFSAAVLVKK